jgi:hypothetical protein
MWTLGTLNVPMLRDSSTSNVVFAGETTSLPTLLQGEKEMQIFGGKIPYCVEVVQRFLTEMLQQVPDLCTVCFWTLSWRRITLSPRLEDLELFPWKYFASFLVWQGVCTSIDSTLDDLQKMVASILPEIGVTRYLFPG